MSLLNIVRKKQGMPPGTLIFTGEQKVEKIKIDVFQYNSVSIIEKNIENVEELKGLVNSESVLWVNICGLHEVDKLGKAGEIFNISSLEMEDILNVAHSPKLEELEDHIFMICKMLNFDNNSKKISVEQVSFILGKNYLITFQEREGDVFNLVRERLRNGKGRLRKLGTDYLMYRLLDSIVDTYAIIILELDEMMEKIEDELLDDPKQETIEDIYSFRKEVNKLRRSIVPLKEVIYTVEKDAHPLIQKSKRS
jgi:magnesium transporter